MRVHAHHPYYVLKSFFEVENVQQQTRPSKPIIIEILRGENNKKRRENFKILPEFGYLNKPEFKNQKPDKNQIERILNQMILS